MLMMNSIFDIGVDFDDGLDIEIEYGFDIDIDNDFDNDTGT